MPNTDDLARLAQGVCHDPFSVLGGHADTQGCVWRVLLPHAESAWLDTAEGWQAMEPADHAVFLWRGSRGGLPRHPRIAWTDADGCGHETVDPYSFKPKLPKKKLKRFLAGTGFDSHRILGAHVRVRHQVPGVRFAVWAPNALRVSVVGDFNGWHGAAHPMAAVNDSGVWTLFVPHLTPGTVYRYEITDGDRVWGKADPYARRAQPRPSTASVVAGPELYEWHDQEWLARRARADSRHEAMCIYEVHVGSWRGPGASYRELADQLIDYVEGRGFTHIELMPIAEHPLDDSWGYQTTGYFAPTSRYGEPDDLRYLVDQAHQHGIGVIVDWTPAHFPKDAHGLSLFDGTFLYEHVDPADHEHPDWNTLVFDYGRSEIRSFLFSNAAYWLKDFHFDGLRVDAVSSMLYLDYSREPGTWTPNAEGGNENLAAMQFLRDLNTRLHVDYPGVVIIAEESIAWPQVSHPVYSGGLGFSMQWNLGWMHDVLDYLQHDPIHRRHHHGAITFAAQHACSGSSVLPLPHDAVAHGKGSLLTRMPGDRWQQLANLRLLFCHQYTTPGRKLLFMGNEMAAERDWDFRASLEWHLLEQPAHAGIARLIDDLNALVRGCPALHRLDFDEAGFRWLDRHDSEQSVIAFLRLADAREPAGHHAEHAVCVMNFTPVPRHGYRIGVPAEGEYLERLNSDSMYYGGSNVGNGGRVASEPVPWMGQSQSVALSLPPLGALVLTPAAQSPP